MRSPVVCVRTAVVALALVLSACAADPPLVPVTELTPIEPAVQLDRLWGAELAEAHYARFTPWVRGGNLFVADRSGRVSRRDLSSGEPMWSVDLSDDQPSRRAVAALGSGVSANATHAFVSSDNGVVYALSTDTGAVEWTAEASSEVLVPVSVGYGVVLVRSADGRMLALEPATGEERWSVSFTPPSLTLHGYSRPLSLDGGALAGLDDGRVVALDLNNGRTIWETVLSVPSGRSEVERLVDVDADIRVDRSGIYVVNYQGRLARVEPARGQVVWSVALSSTAGFTLSGNQIVVVDDEDVVRAFDREDGQERWSTSALRGRSLSPPATTAAGDIVVGDFEGYLHILSVEDGTLLARRRVDRSSIRTRPVVADGTLVVQSDDGTLMALQPTTR